jgi:metallo-beta-lactamase superfamily protein
LTPLVTTGIPAADELEISLFGPGLGECIVVHLGGGEWMVVDSCVDESTREPVALEYLSKLGMDMGRAVRLVVVTHWHDDHMLGAARLVDASANALFVCSAALRTPEFFKLVAEDQDLALANSKTSGISEFARVLNSLGNRNDQSSPEWASASRRLFFRPASDVAPECEVFALSPSSSSITAAFGALASLVPSIVGTPKRALVSPEPNQTAVVLHVRLGARCALLGADLETGQHPKRGWLAIINDGNRPQHPAHVYKVAHHGSRNADHPGIWRDLLAEKPIAVLTPFFRGRVSLPGRTDVERIKEKAIVLYSAAQVRSPPPARRMKTVERTIRETARSFRTRAGRMGQVRVRLSPTTQDISVFNAALQL